MSESDSICAHADKLAEILTITSSSSVYDVIMTL